MVDKKLVSREILLSFWKIHVLYHASERGVVGSWMLHELRHHGYDVSPGTLFPLLKRLEACGWLESEVDGEGPRAKRTYRITEDGEEVLRIVRKQMRELGIEVGKEQP